MFQGLNAILDNCDTMNSQELQAANHFPDGDVNYVTSSGVPECSRSTCSGGEPKRKKRKFPFTATEMVHASTDTEIIMVDQACQTDLPFTSNSPQKYTSIPLADVRHAVLHDHSYASRNLPDEVSNEQGPDVSVSVPKAKRSLDFPETLDVLEIECNSVEISEDEWMLSDDESDLSDCDDVDFHQEENSDFEDDDGDMKTEVPDDDDENESSNWLREDSGDLHEERKFVVFESKLKDLFSRYVHCPNCGRGVQNATLKTKGSVATIESLGCCNQPLRWQTQPFVSSMAAGNLLLSAGILFTGNDYGNIANLAKATNLQFFSQRNFTSTQKKYLFPIVNKTFTEHQVDLFNEVKNTQVVAGGDGRCDSPGHSAKYGTYSVVDTASSKVLDFSLVQVTEVNNSNAMELEGLKRCLDHLQEEEVLVAKLATDRHVQVRAHLKRERPEIKHNFDVWHMAKSVQKKLTKKAQTKPCAALKPWIHAIITHLWWCAKSSQGNATDCVERWKSIVYHTVNIHHWDGCQHFHQCAHPPIPRETERRKEWLKVGSPAHDALKEVVWNKLLLKDIAMLAEFIHTGIIEMYHGLMAKKYCQKVQHYSYDGMRARTQLAILDHNHNVGREQAQTKEGAKKHKFVSPKGSQGWIAKPQYEDKSYEFLDDLMAALLAFKKGDIEVPPLPPKPVAANIARTIRPPKDDLLEKHRSRFNTSN